MTIFYAILIFLVVAGLTWRYSDKVPLWLFRNLEYFLIVIALIGILTAIAQVESESRKTKALQLTNNAEQLFGSILSRIEYRMDQCGVWWNVALDQTNKNPAACQASDKCKEACRTAHMISQYRWRPIETELSDWENFQSLICHPSLRDPICDRTDKFIEVLGHAKSADTEAEAQFLANSHVLIFVQLFAGFALGLEFGKIRAKKQ
jgi:type II secretory pathway pseudopilin PulG